MQAPLRLGDDFQPAGQFGADSLSHIEYPTELLASICEHGGPRYVLLLVLVGALKTVTVLVPLPPHPTSTNPATTATAAMVRMPDSPFVSLE
jgi:hypothetical protein